MSTEFSITITVRLPEGSSMTPHVGSGIVTDEPPLPEAPSDVAPQRPQDSQCPVHHVQWRTVPAGVSAKTGNPYSEFRACPEKGCTQRPR